MSSSTAVIGTAPDNNQGQSPIVSHSKAVDSYSMDFWFIGGASFVAWLFSKAAEHYVNTNPLFDRQIMSWPFAFSALTLFCNHPHFISSYRIGYAQSASFMKKHWFSMLFVPVSLLLLLFVAFQKSEGNFGNTIWLSNIDAMWPNLPILNSLVHSPDLGSELLRFGVWLMWITVGWHYSKQIFGIMLLYARASAYPISRLQRQLLRYCLLSVVPTSFFALSLTYNGNPGMFNDLVISPFEFSQSLVTFCKWISGILVLGFGAGLLINYLKTKAIPPLNFVTAFAVFYLWWFPGFWPQPYGMMMVPFFHSLQYLPFAFRRIRSELPKTTNIKRTLTVNILVILMIGFVFFDLLPGWLDQSNETHIHFGSSFYLISFSIFLNVHHFFIDSVIWRTKREYNS